MLDVQADSEHKPWYDFVVECEYLFLRNIYSNNDLQKMKIDDIEKYYEIFDRLVELFPVVESALGDGDVCFEFRGLMEVELHSTLRETKEDIDNIVIAKKKKRFCKSQFFDKIINFIYSSLFLCQKISLIT